MRSEAPVLDNLGFKWTPEWLRYFKNEALALMGWNKSMTVTATIDFPNVGATSESAASTVTVTGARTGDVVHVQPTTNVAGMFFKGSVTADNTVSVYACNFSSAGINPASQSYRIIVIQN